MPKRTRNYDTWLSQQLTDANVAAHYINAAIADTSEMLLVALRNVAEAHKMANVAEKAGVAREALYKTLSEEGNPRIETLLAVLKAMGLRIAVEPDEPTVIPKETSESITIEQAIPTGAKLFKVWKMGATSPVLHESKMGFILVSGPSDSKALTVHH